MAVTADTVEVRLEADIASYLRNLKTADAAFLASTRKMQTEAVLAGRALDIPARALNETQQQVNRFNTGNLAAQFQDIGVTAAGGMNPLLIALQQGTQLSAVLNAEIQQGQNPVKALGAAFAQIINPISLATIAAVALGAAALQSLGSILPSTETANEALKKHRKELEGIVEGYEAAEDAVEDYFDSASRTPSGIATDQVIKKFSDLSEEADKFRERAQQLGDLFSNLEFASEAERKFGELSSSFADGSITAEEYYRELESLKESLSGLEGALGFLPGSLRSVVVEMQDGTEKAIAFGNAINNLVSSSATLAGLAVNQDLQNALDLSTYIAEQERVNGLTAEELDLEKEIASIKKDADKFGITEAEAKELAEATLAAEKRRADLKKQNAASDRAETKDANKYERERKAITDLLAEMNLEAAVLGQSNREKAIAVALSKANATATEEERAAIAQLAGFTYDTEQAVKKLNEASTEWANTIQGATRGFIDDLIEGKSAAEAFANVLSDIGSKLLDFGLDNLFGSSGFNLSGLLGGRGFPTRATGGSVYAGNPTMINERGQEIFVPSTPGKMIPASQVGGGGSVTFAPVIDARGADVAAVARLEGVVQRLAADVVPTIRREMAVSGKKGRTRG